MNRLLRFKLSGICKVLTIPVEVRRVAGLREESDPCERDGDGDVTLRGLLASGVHLLPVAAELLARRDKPFFRLGLNNEFMEKIGQLISRSKLKILNSKVELLCV